MFFDFQIAIMTEEIQGLKNQASKYRRERETYKEMVESLQKNRPASRAGDSSSRDKVGELQYKVQVLEDELADAKLETSKANAQLTALQSTHEIQVRFVP